MRLLAHTIKIEIMNLHLLFFLSVPLLSVGSIAAQVICYRTDSGSLIAAQVLMNRQPTGEIKVFRAGEYDF